MRLSLSTVSAVTVLCLSSVLVGSASGAESSHKAEQNLRKTQEAVSGEKKKHVLFISVDDLNNWVGYTGVNPQSKTPNFDRLAKMGVAFTNAHASSTICNPSRAAVWSGTRPSTTGCYDNRDHPWTRYIGEGLGLNAHFKNNGYYVAARGKTYHSSQGGANKADWIRKATVRVDEWDKYPKVENRYPLKPSYHDGWTQDYPKWAHKDFDDKSDPDWHTVDFCEKMLNGAPQRDKPLFLACGIVKPHLPWVVPQKYYDMYPKDEIQLPGGLADTKQRQRDMDDVPKPGIDLAHPEKEFRNVTKLNREIDAIQSYLATIAYADMNLGRLLDAYENSPDRDNTILVLWSDHGYHLGEKSHWKKQTLWEEATDVPFIWVVPGLTPKGVITNKPVDLQSIYPTLCDLVGIPIPEHVDGDNIRPLLENPDADWDGVALSTMRYKNHAVRDERYRYIRYYNGDEELYDHKFDPHEFTNLAKKDEYLPIKERLAKHFPKVNMKLWYDGQSCVDGGKQHIKTCPDGTKVARDPNKNCKYMDCPAHDPLVVDDGEDWKEEYDPRPEEESPDDGELAEYDEVNEQTPPVMVTPTTPSNTLVPVLSAVKCYENPETIFNNAKGLVRACKWLNRAAKNIERECTGGLALQTDADKACPISCGKCKPSTSSLNSPISVDGFGGAGNGSVGGSCVDSGAKFTSQRGRIRPCEWLQRRESASIAAECSNTDAARVCPKTCNVCRVGKL